MSSIQLSLPQNTLAFKSILESMFGFVSTVVCVETNLTETVGVYEVVIQFDNKATPQLISELGTLSWSDKITLSYIDLENPFVLRCFISNSNRNFTNEVKELFTFNSKIKSVFINQKECVGVIHFESKQVAAKLLQLYSCIFIKYNNIRYTATIKQFIFPEKPIVPISSISEVPVVNKTTNQANKTIVTSLEHCFDEFDLQATKQNTNGYIRSCINSLIKVFPSPKELEGLSVLAMTENWGNNCSVLLSYVEHTFFNIFCTKEQRHKTISFFKNANQLYAIIDTRLLDKYMTSIFAIFSVSTMDNFSWRFHSWKNEYSAKQFSKLEKLPDAINYIQNIEESIFNPYKGVDINFEHIISDNYKRIEEALNKITNFKKEQAQMRLEFAWRRALSFCKLNYFYAVPHFYRGQIAFLIPLNFNLDSFDTSAHLVAAVLKQQNGENEYVWKTILTPKMAYISARVMMKTCNWLQSPTSDEENSNLEENSSSILEQEELVVAPEVVQVQPPIISHLEEVLSEDDDEQPIIEPMKNQEPFYQIPIFQNILQPVEKNTSSEDDSYNEKLQLIMNVCGDRYQPEFMLMCLRQAEGDVNHAICLIMDQN